MVLPYVPTQRSQAVGRWNVFDAPPIYRCGGVIFCGTKFCGAVDSRVTDLTYGHPRHSVGALSK